MSASRGNFHNYYDFNAVEERLQHFPWRGLVEMWRAAKQTQMDTGEVSGSELIHGEGPCEGRDEVRDSRGGIALSVLDIGCNEGDITLATVKHLKSMSNGEERILAFGIDVDDELIARAAKKTPAFSDSATVAFQTADFISSDAPHSFLKDRMPSGSGRFSLVFVLSITMWIHVNAGDAGLERFIRKAAALADQLIIEPHEYRSYKTMNKRLKKLKAPIPPAFHELQHRQDVVPWMLSMLEDAGMTLHEELGVTKWGRRLLWYRRDQ